MYLKEQFIKHKEWLKTLSYEEKENYYEYTQCYDEIQKITFKSKIELFDKLQRIISETISINEHTEKETSINIEINLFNDWGFYDSGGIDHTYNHNSSEIIKLIKKKTKGIKIKQVYVDDKTDEFWLSSNQTNIEIYC